jgi:SAM-dependent methyltransferase
VSAPPEGRASYTTAGIPGWRILRDGYHQFRAVRRQVRTIGPFVADVLRDHAEARASMESLAGMPIRGLRTLEIGHGQIQTLIAFIAASGNDASGIDLDVTPTGLTDLAGYARLLRSNGPLRTLKSLVREASGINRAIRREFCRQQGLPGWPSYRQYAMDATRLEFGAASFDFVYSTDVFEHLPDPAATLREVRRVLRPGGAYWIKTLHYAHYNALHDNRWIAGGAEPAPPWAHLLPESRGLVEQGAWVNTLRIDDWRRLALETWPDARIELLPTKDKALVSALEAARAAGKLDGFGDDELLASHVVIAGRSAGI